MSNKLLTCFLSFGSHLTQSDSREEMTEEETEDTAEQTTEDTIEETGTTTAMAGGIDLVGLDLVFLFPLWL